MLIASFQTWKSRSSSSFLQAALRIFPHWAFYLTLKWHTLIGPPSKLNLFNSLLDFRGKTGFVLHTLIVLLFLRHHRRSFCSNILQHVGSILTHTGRQTCLTLSPSLSVCLLLSLLLAHFLFQLLYKSWLSFADLLPCSALLYISAPGDTCKL